MLCHNRDHKTIATDGNPPSLSPATAGRTVVRFILLAQGCPKYACGCPECLGSGKLHKCHQLTKILTGWRKSCLRILSSPESSCAQAASKVSGLRDRIQNFSAQGVSRMSKMDGGPVDCHLLKQNLTGGCKQQAKRFCTRYVQNVQNVCRGDNY